MFYCSFFCRRASLCQPLRECPAYPPMPARLPLFPPGGRKSVLGAISIRPSRHMEIDLLPCLPQNLATTHVPLLPFPPVRGWVGCPFDIVFKDPLVQQRAPGGAIADSGLQSPPGEPRKTPRGGRLQTGVCNRSQRPRRPPSLRRIETGQHPPNPHSSASQRPGGVGAGSTVHCPLVGQRPRLT